MSDSLWRDRYLLLSSVSSSETRIVSSVPKRWLDEGSCSADVAVTHKLVFLEVGFAGPLSGAMMRMACNLFVGLCSQTARLPHWLFGEQYSSEAMNNSSASTVSISLQPFPHKTHNRKNLDELACRVHRASPCLSELSEDIQNSLRMVRLVHRTVLQIFDSIVFSHRPINPARCVSNMRMPLHPPTKVHPILCVTKQQTCLLSLSWKLSVQYLYLWKGQVLTMREATQSEKVPACSEPWTSLLSQMRAGKCDVKSLRSLQTSHLGERISAMVFELFLVMFRFTWETLHPKRRHIPPPPLNTFHSSSILLHRWAFCDRQLSRNRNAPPNFVLGIRKISHVHRNVLE